MGSMAFYVNWGISQVLGLAAVSIIFNWVLNDGNGLNWNTSKFNWHPVCMTVGMLYLFGNSVMLYRAFRNMSKPILKKAHAFIHLGVIVCIIVGLVSVVQEKNSGNQTHLYSLHSWIGVGTMVFFGLQWVVSVLVFLWPGGSMNLRAWMMPYHVYIGMALLVTAIISCVTGAFEELAWIRNYSDLPAKAVKLNVFGICSILFGVFVVYLVSKPEYKRKPLDKDYHM